MRTRSFTKFLSLPASDRKLLVAAAITLLGTWIRLRWYGLASAQRWVAVPPSGAHHRPRLEDVLHVASLVGVASRHSPFPSSCLTRSLALVRLLKKAGIESQLRIGVRMTGTALDAHAWVEYAGMPVNDTADVAQRFAAFSEPLPLSAFPTR